jgi:DNA-directed RNA polymerase subunit N (RpoN/RPB10)
MKYLICPTCGKVLGDIEIEYENKSSEIMMLNISEQEKIVKKRELIENMGITRYCCKMRIFTQIDPYKIIK